MRVETITSASAVAWLAGEIDDDGVEAGSEVVFWRELENLGEYRASLAAIASAKSKGARAMMARACSRVVAHKFKREGGTPTLSESRHYRGQKITAERWCLAPEQFDLWTKKFSENPKL